MPTVIAVCHDTIDESTCFHTGVAFMPAAVSASYCLRAAASWSVKKPAGGPKSQGEKLLRLRRQCGKLADDLPNDPVQRSLRLAPLGAGFNVRQAPCGLVGLFRDAPTSPGTARQHFRFARLHLRDGGFELSDLAHGSLGVLSHAVEPARDSRESRAGDVFRKILYLYRLHFYFNLDWKNSSVVLLLRLGGRDVSRCVGQHQRQGLIIHFPQNIVDAPPGCGGDLPDDAERAMGRFVNRS